jgi:hypothetical protein
MRRTTFLLACVLTLAALGAPARAQETFSDAGVDYTLELPTATWKATSRPDSVHQHVEFVNGDRMDGYLRIRKEAVKHDETPAVMAERDADLKLRYKSGYVGGGKAERFAGRLNGVTMGYEYTEAGKQMAGRVYYLQADNHTVYKLHFTGLREKLQRARNQTDSIARSFRLKR